MSIVHEIKERNLSAVPEIGQLVSVRKRQYVVSDIIKSALPSTFGLTLLDARHLVTLQSVEDDALGEELQVIWELEPGAQVFEDIPLPQPTGLDDPGTLEAFLNAVRWGAITSTDTRALQAPFRSGITIEDYQLDPLVRALQMPRVNLLIADDVGLGKTIEAGLIIQELILRHRARTVLVVCPASLQLQWRDQMRDKFGLEFRIVDSALLKNLRRTRGIMCNPWSHFPRLITSVDYIKRERPLRLMREILPPEGVTTYPRRFDMLVIDEAHGIAPQGKGKYATDSMKTLAIRTIAPHFEHRLFLTATPHNGYRESFTALLELLDNQRFARDVEPPKDQLGAIIIRRLKSELPAEDNGAPRFPERVLLPIEVPYTEEERKLHRLLKGYTSSRLSHIQDKTEEFATKFVLVTLKKRLFSSPLAFKLTLSQHEKSLRASRKADARTLGNPSYGILKRQVDQLEEEYADDSAWEETHEEAVGTASRMLKMLSGEEYELLRKLRETADIAARKPDSKALQLIAWLNETIRPRGSWSDNRVIIFTEYRATQKWLFDLLSRERLTEEGRTLILYGGMDLKERERVKAAFQSHPSESAVRILLATDAASEGIDLQNHCARLIHYEIPWNPNRLEQRNGRIDRHGQRGIKDEKGLPQVLIYHFVGKSYRKADFAQTKPENLEDDLEFLKRALHKVQNIREDIGKVGPVIASQVERVMLGLQDDLETSRAENDAKALRKMLKFERNIREQVGRLMSRLEESKEMLHLTPESVESVIRVGLQIAGQPPLERLMLSDKDGEPGDFYDVPHLRGSWGRCFEGLAHPHTGKIRPITFDERLARGRDDVVLAHLWQEEPVTLQAFCNLLGAYRLFGAPPNETLEALFSKSLAEQHDITDQLGFQVRQAVEVFVRTIDRIDYEENRNLFKGVTEKRLYEAALAVMMRLVFLFCAEERKMLPLDDDFYNQHYAVSTIGAQLRETADQYGEEILERRHDAWCRLLATFRAVHGGITHDRLTLPAYGGQLFDPDRYPFLEGRQEGTSWKATPADPVPIDNRTVLHLLEALQILQVRIPGGRMAEARRLSFRALDIEQIGHVYEGLLDHTVFRAQEPILGLRGSRYNEPEIPLSLLEEYRMKGVDTLVDYLSDETGRSRNAIKKEIESEPLFDSLAKLQMICGKDSRLLERVRPFASLVRDDTFGYPIIVQTGSFYVTQGSDRRTTGTHYTPKSLTEPIVKHTLEPLVFEGPEEGKSAEEWRLRPAKEILALKVCDMAMGSGAFLVQACRYLSERLVDAWDAASAEHKGARGITYEGKPIESDGEEHSVPLDADDQLALARRLIVDRCLYGVDKNPMAVEMAKLSLWLVTMQKNIPFTFLDHALKCGDSLLGITDFGQVERFNITGEAGSVKIDWRFPHDCIPLMKKAIEKRLELEGFMVRDTQDFEIKRLLHEEANHALET